MKQTSDRLRNILAPLALSFFVLPFGTGGVRSAQAEVEDISEPVEVVADRLDYVRAEKKIVAEGTVAVTYKSVKLSADKAEVFTETKKAYAEGHVLVVDGGRSLRADKVYYDFKNHQGSFPGGATYEFPWYGSGQEINQVSKDEIRVFKGKVTTCNFEKPHYDITARRATIYPDDRMILRNVTIRALEKPIFWLPYLNIPLGNEAPVELIMGHSDELGWYVRAAKRMAISRYVQIKPHYDWFSRRGHGFGLDTKYQHPEIGEGEVLLYQIRDRNSPDPRAPSPFLDRDHDRSRGRASVRHRTDFGRRSNVILQWHEFPDEFFLSEYFEKEDREETQPSSQVVFTQNSDTYGFTTEVRKRTNRFFPEQELLPRVRFDWKNDRLFDTNLFYKNTQEVANFNQKSERSAEDQDVVRLLTAHEISSPWRFQGVKFIPFGNVREVYYSKHANGSENHTRNLLGMGFESRTRFHRLFDVYPNFLGMEINQLRHLFEPSFRYDAIRHDSINQFTDRIIRMDGTDSTTIADDIRFGMENKLQTKRKARRVKGGLRRVDILSYSQFINYSIHNQSFGGNESRFTDWEHRSEIRPYDWLVMATDVVYNFPRKQIREVSTDISLETERVNFVLLYGESKDINEVGGDREIVVTDVEVQLNERWKLGGYVRYDFQDEDPIDEWEVRAIRDLHDFLLTIGYNVRLAPTNSKKRSHNKELYFVFTMKEFPLITLESGNRVRFVRPRIGRYIAGQQEATLGQEYTREVRGL